MKGTKVQNPRRKSLRKLLYLAYYVNSRARKLAMPRVRVCMLHVAERVVLSVLAPTRASGITAL